MGAPMLTIRQLQRELTYRTSMAVLANLRTAGLVTGREFVDYQAVSSRKDSPRLGRFVSKSRLTLYHKEGYMVAEGGVI